MSPMPEWELEVIRRSLAMSATLPADQAQRLLDEIRRLLDELRRAREECCRADGDGST